MKTAVVVQARTGSSRLPGKVLMPLNGRTVLEEVLHRCRAIPGADAVVCAIPDLPEDDALAATAERVGSVVVRGSSSDVLSRYRRAADVVEADVVMRITADCPLIDPELCGQVLLLRASRGVDYAANNLPPRFPHGLDCEAFTAASLRDADAAATAPYEREHVTPWLRTTPHVTRAALDGPGGATASQRWTLDYPEDYEFFVRLFALLSPGSRGWRETAAVVEANPDIADINRQRRVR